MNNYHHYYWGPLLVKTTVDMSIIDKLMSYSKNLTKKHNKYLAGKIDYEYLYEEHQTKELFQDLKQYFEGYLYVLINHWHQNPTFKNYEIIPSEMWINKQLAGEYNPLHCHDGDISWIIYADIPNEIYKEEKYNRDDLEPGAIAWKNNLQRTKLTGSIRDLLEPVDVVKQMPKKGEMFIFPSSLWHEVEPFKTKGVERISIAGNIKLIDIE